MRPLSTRPIIWRCRVSEAAECTSASGGTELTICIGHILSVEGNFTHRTMRSRANNYSLRVGRKFEHNSKHYNICKKEYLTTQLSFSRTDYGEFEQNLFNWCLKLLLKLHQWKGVLEKKTL